MDLVIEGVDQNLLVNQTYEAMSKDSATRYVDKTMLMI